MGREDKFHSLSSREVPGRAPGAGVEARKKSEAGDCPGKGHLPGQDTEGTPRGNGLPPAGIQLTVYRWPWWEGRLA